MCPVQEQLVNKFVSLPDVFKHILTEHRDDFVREYSATTRNYNLCKVGNCYIRLEGCDTHYDVRAREMQHYIGHGRIFLASLGVLSPGVESGCLCNLCSQVVRS